MHINHKDNVLVDSEQYLHFQKAFPNNLILSWSIVFDNPKMIQYQKDLFMDYFSDLTEGLAAEDILFSQAKKLFEDGLKDINVKLQVFAEKMSETAPFRIHGIVQLVFHDDYLASFIGKSGLVIIRDKKLHYTLTNKPEETELIDQFSEILEWEVKINDTLVTAWFDLETYLDRDDVATILATSDAEDKPFLDTLEDVVTTRIANEEIRFISSITGESSFAVTQKKLRKRIDGPLKAVVDKLGWWERLQSHLLYWLIWVVSLLLLYGLFQSFYNANNDTFVGVNEWETIDINIQDIQRDISMFEKIDPSSDQKIKKYEEILTKLDILLENEKWIDDVNKYKMLLEEKYLEGFNIISANNDAFFSNPVYEFSQTELNTFWTPKQIFFTDSLMIAGEEWILLDAINSEQRWSLISAWIDQDINVCGFNLLRNGLYCDTNTWLFNIVQQGFQPVSTDDGTFPTDIVWIGRFWTSNMYLLTDDSVLNSWNIFITRYGNRLWSQETFGPWANYPIRFWEESDTRFVWSWFSSFAIDGTFLSWSRADRGLFQFWREPNSISTDLNYRKVPLNGWDTLNPYSEDVKVIAFEGFRYVYLFDRDNQTFTVYRSSPYKTNSAYTYDYSLEYLFRIQFGFDEFDIQDVFVREWENSRLYMLTDSGVHSLSLADNIDRFNRQLDSD